MGFNYMAWKVSNLKEKKGQSEVTFTYNSYDGEEGKVFPINCPFNI